MPIKKKEITRYFELKAELSKLGQECELLKSKFRDELEASGEDTLHCHGAEISIIEGKVMPKWKDAFVAKCGVAAAQEVIAATDPCRQLSITRKR